MPKRPPDDGEWVPFNTCSKGKENEPPCSSKGRHVKKNPENNFTTRTHQEPVDSLTLLENCCLFCKSSTVKQVSGHRYNLQNLQIDSHRTIEDKAKELQDENLLLVFRDAKDAQFHDCCRKQYLVRRAPQSLSLNKQLIQQAFCRVHDFIKSVIIKNGKVAKLSHLTTLYNDVIQSSESTAAIISSHALRLKIENCPTLQNLIDFSSCNFKETLVFSTSPETVKRTVRYAYEMGKTDWSKEIALELHEKIWEAYKTSKSQPWPPRPGNIPDPKTEIPPDVLNFVLQLVSGEKSPSSREEDLALSIGQDLCRAATSGQWKMRKHILLCMTLRHLFRSKSITTLIHRLGHCESYTYSLELETALANSIKESASLLSNSPILKAQPDGAVFHCDWDNFDQLVANIYGAGSIHTAAGIYMQDLGSCESAEMRTSTNPPQSASSNVQPRNRQRSFKCDPLDLTPYYKRKRSEPVNLVSTALSYCTLTKPSDKYLLWLLSRSYNSKIQLIPGFSGWTSLTGKYPKCLSEIGYFPMINAPITNLDTIQECLRLSHAATSETGQVYTICTFDLGVCMKAFPLIWNEPEKYKKHVLLLGTFHCCGAYLKGIGRRYCQGSGWIEVALEANLISTGSVAGVTDGKNWDRAMNTHKSMLEALERLLYEKFLEMHRPLSSPSVTSLENLPISEQSTDAVLSSQDIHNHMVDYKSFRERVKNGELGETCQFWFEYMQCIWLVLSLISAIKTNDYESYRDALKNMPDLFFCSDQQNYARFLTYFAYFLEHIEETHPGAEKLLRAGAISVARSHIPGNRCHTDKTIEETAMKWLKSKSGSGTYSTGLCGITSNYEASQRHILTAHAKGEFVEALWNIVSGRDNAEKHHKDLRPSEILQSEKQVQHTVQAFKSFINPFTLPLGQPLTSLSSGAAMREDVRYDVLNALRKGQEQKLQFIQDRLLLKKTQFFDPIKRNKFKTMSSVMPKKTIVATNQKVIQYKATSGFIFQVFLKSQLLRSQISISEIMSYPLTLTPYSISTIDGFFAKNNKAQGMNYIIQNIENGQLPSPSQCVLIQDGNSSFYMSDVPQTMRGISSRIFKCLPSAAETIFSTDTYLDRLHSPKSAERDRRGCGEHLIVKGLNIRRPTDWKSFLTNDQNKKSLIHLVLEHWSSAEMNEDITKRPVIFIEAGQAYKIESHDGQTTKTPLPEIRSSHEETDVRVMIYINYIDKQMPHITAVRVRAKDSDVFFILLYYVNLFRVQIIFDMGDRLINMNQLANNYTQEQTSALLSLHAFTGADCNSAFKGKGKVRPIKLMIESSKFIQIFDAVGTSWELNQCVLEGIEEFTCRLYGCGPHIKEINLARVVKIKKLCGSSPMIHSGLTVDLSTFPPCKRVLFQHIKRVNFQVCIWKKALEHFPEIPQPTEHGFYVNQEDGKLEPLWFEGDVIPPEIVDVLAEDGTDEDDIDEIHTYLEEDDNEDDYLSDD